MEACRTGSWAHSPIYLFMVENFDRCAEAWADKKVRWARMAAAFAEDGLTNLDGGAAQPETLKKTWYRVRAKVAEGRVRLAEEAERKARERLRRKHERDILDAARHAAAPDLRPAWQSRPAYQVMPGADGFTIPSEPADRIAPTPAQAAPAVAPLYAAPPPATRHQEPVAVAVEPLAEGDPLLLSPLASQEELDRSDQDWPYQKPRAQWGEIRVLTVETLEAQPENARKWRYGPDLPPERGFERLPLKMTFESEDDWLRCWYYLFKKRQREAPLPQTYAEVIIGIAAGRVALELPMEVCLKRQALGRANRAATRGIFS